jgi:3-hydroxyisobutyrate dehydrogenase-like beta-hydroxyacid dehydrogenase
MACEFTPGVRVILSDALVVGVVGSGAMGSALGARLRDGGQRVVTALEGRSRRSRLLAAEAGLEDVGPLAALLRASDIVLSVVPPEAAVALAEAVAEATGDARPLVADLNAVSPATMERVSATLAASGLGVVDGSISGPPPTRAGTTRVYLSGARAAEIATLAMEGVERVVVGESIGLASAVKMCTASVYKGRVALLTQALRTAHHYGVVDHVLDDLAGTGLADPERTGATIARASTKAWRYVAEMEEISETQGSAGLTPELFRALAEVYSELSRSAIASAPEDVEDETPLVDVLARVSAGAGGPDGAEDPRRTG